MLKTPKQHAVLHFYNFCCPTFTVLKPSQGVCGIVQHDAHIRSVKWRNSILPLLSDQKEEA